MIKWHLEELVTMIDGRLFCNIKRVYQFYEWVTGHEGIMTHQLPGYFKRLARRVAQYAGIDFDQLKADVDEMMEHVPMDNTDLNILEARSEVENKVRDWLVKNKGYKSEYPIPANIFADDEKPDLLDGIPEDKQVAIINMGNGEERVVEGGRHG